jgi:putative transcriptional regulator
MKINAHLTDEAVLRELGERLSAARVSRNLTQAHVAEEAGISKRTLERLEAGAVSY